MENSRNEKLSEILRLIENVQAEITSIKSKLANLEFETPSGTPDNYEDETKEEIDVIDIVEIQDILPSDDIIEEPEREIIENIIEEKEEKKAKEEEREEDLILKGSDGMEPAEIKRTAVVDKMLEREAWRTDRPSSPVKDVRSAIALNDRILLINTLFKGDPEKFQQTVSTINAMDTLDNAVAYIKENFPDWKMESDSVYRFMMAVRRKLDK